MAKVVNILRFCVFLSVKALRSKISIKKIKKIFYITLLVVALLFGGILIALRLPFVQNYLIEKVSDSIEERTGSKIKIGKVTLSGLSDIQLENVLLSDNYKDTLLYVKKLRTEISSIYFRSNNFQLEHTELEEPYFKIVSYADGSMNLYTFLDALESPSDSTENTGSSFFSISSAVIKNGRFVYTDVNKKPVDFGMNYDDMDFYNINAKVNHIRTVGGAIKMNINSIQSREKSGFRVRGGKTELTIASGLLQFDKLRFRTAKSLLNAKMLKFSYEPNTPAWSNFTSSVMLDYKIQNSRINLDEMALFNSTLRGYEQTLQVSGHATGILQNLRVENAKITTNNETLLKGNIALKGLPNIDETFIDANISDFQTSLDDLEKIKIPNYEEGYISFPQSLKKLGIFSYKGKFLGFISDFVFYGQFSSEFGDLKTDISVKPTTKTKQLELSGKMVTTDFELGNLLSNNMLGKVSLNVDILNAMANDDYSSYAKLKGVINSIEINKYPYQNIRLNGLFAEKIFDGDVKMKDKNIAFDFKGKVDFHENIPKTNFTFKLDYAKLHPLNFDVLSKDEKANISFVLQSNLNGGSIDETTGEIAINDLKYQNSKGKLATQSIRLNSKMTENERFLTLSSDFVDAEFKGNFKISTLSDLPTKLLEKYIPNPQKEQTDSIVNERGSLDVTLKMLNPLLFLFMDGFKISNNTKITANYVLGDVHKFNASVDAELLRWGSRSLHKVQLKAVGRDTLQTDFKIAKIGITEKSHILDFGIKNTLANSLMNTDIHWGDKQRFSYGGNITANTVFQRLENGHYAILNTFSPSEIFFDNESWKVNESRVAIDSTDIKIEDFRISNSHESLELGGIWSPKREKKLNARVDNIELEHLWKVFRPVDLDLTGKLSGHIIYEDSDENDILEADLQVPKLVLGKQDLGALSIFSDWEQNNTLCTRMILEKAGEKLLHFEGNYNTKSDELDYLTTLNGVDLQPVKSFVEPHLNKLEGMLSGTMNLTGTASKPIINGGLDLKITEVVPAETGVAYHLDERVAVKNNRIDFDNFKLLDKENNVATVNGSVLLQDDVNTSVNLKVKTQKLRILEDSYQPLAYGNAHVSADLGIKGNLEHIKVRGKVKTDDYSKVIVPFDSASEVEDNDFITFINPADSLFNQGNQEILFIPTGATSPVSFNVDFSINPTSEIQVLFESKSGSILKSKGKADLLISRNQQGKQSIIGEYKVSKGFFLYSLENIVTKKFILQEGGTIRWNGAPEKAYVDLRAVYKTKASVLPLLYQDANTSKQRQTTVLCKAHITGQLENPSLNFEIEFPNLERTTAGNVKAALQTTNMTKQMLSLLIFNQFRTPEYNANVSETNNASALSVTTSELLSNQISNILSQLSDAVNIGFIYRPGDDLTKEELGLVLSAELLKNRVVISGNLGFASEDNNSRFNDFTGDFNLDFRLNKKGTLQFRIFSHARDNIYLYRDKKNIQGAGIIYNEEFDTFKELWQHYKEKLGWRRKKTKK